MSSSRRVTPALAIAITLLMWPRALKADLDEREGLIVALKELGAQLLLVKHRATADELQSAWASAVSNARFLEEKARLWKPRRRDDGKQTRVAIQRLALTLSAVVGGSVTNESEVLRTAFDDLAQKALYCKLGGLSAEPTVVIWTKRNGREEVNGLEVWFLEKFVAMVNPRAAPHRFNRFSSPVKANLPAGSYLFWATDPATGKVGPKAEGCACDYHPGLLTRASFEFEILSP